MMNRLNEMELNKVTGGKYMYGEHGYFEIPVIGLDGPAKKRWATETFGGGIPGQGNVEINDTFSYKMNEFLGIRPTDDYTGEKK